MTTNSMENQTRLSTGVSPAPLRGVLLFCRLDTLALDPSAPAPFVSCRWLDLGVEGHGNVVVTKMWS